MWLLPLLVGCDTVGIELGDKPDGSDDSGVADSGTPGDDTGGTDDSGTLPDTDTYFSGVVAGTAQVRGQGGGDPEGGGGGRLVYCEGPFYFVLHDYGTWEGDANCVGEADGEGFLGPIDGTLDNARLVGHFAYTGFGYAGDAEVEMERLDQAVDGTIQDQDEGIALSLVLDGEQDAP